MLRVVENRRTATDSPRVAVAVSEIQGVIMREFWSGSYTVFLLPKSGGTPYPMVETKTKRIAVSVYDRIKLAMEEEAQDE